MNEITEAIVILVIRGIKGYTQKKFEKQKYLIQKILDFSVFLNPSVYNQVWIIVKYSHICTKNKCDLLIK